MGWTVLANEQNDEIMDFGSINIESLGFVIQSMDGHLNLPKRKHETIYDWGDGFTALVDENDIFFGTRTIEVYAYWDPKIGSDFRNALQTLRNAVTTETLTTDYGNYSCKISNIDVVKDFKGSGKTVKMTFIELNPDLSGGLPNVVGDGNVRIDGHDFIDFGLLIKSVNGFDVPSLQNSKQTSFESNYLSVFRNPPTVTITMNGIYVSKAEMASKINSFNKTLSNPGLRHFVHDGYGYQCYCPDGFSVNVKGKLVSITAKLTVMSSYNIDEIVQLVIDQITIIGSPQSDLSVTDTNDPAFVKGKPTFKAADSDKLDGNDSTYFAKEGEMAGIRNEDFAADLETQTNF